jgi:NAD(P)-dependent dehydrogenase (short-subunit alcohol dehydrogenase family)
MANVLVTHADEPIGRRIVKLLVHDEQVEVVMAVGRGPAPRAFDRFLA